MQAVSGMGVRRGTYACGVLLLLSVAAADVRRCQVGDTCNINVVELGMKCGECISPVGGKKKPSEDCCRVVRKVDIPCACKYIAHHKLPVGISADKLCYVARCCGIHLKRMKCGEFSCGGRVGGEQNLFWLTDQM